MQLDVEFGLSQSPIDFEQLTDDGSTYGRQCSNTGRCKTPTLPIGWKHKLCPACQSKKNEVNRRNRAKRKAAAEQGGDPTLSADSLLDPIHQPTFTMASAYAPPPQAAPVVAAAPVKRKRGRPPKVDPNIQAQAALAAAQQSSVNLAQPQHLQSHPAAGIMEDFITGIPDYNSQLGSAGGGVASSGIRGLAPLLYPYSTPNSRLIKDLGLQEHTEGGK